MLGGVLTTPLLKTSYNLSLKQSQHFILVDLKPTLRSCLAYLWQCRSNGKHCHVQSAFCNLKVPYMYNKTKTIYRQLKFLHTEAAIKRCSTNMIKTLEKYLQKNPFFSKVAGCRPATLLRMNSFTGIVEQLQLAASVHNTFQTKNRTLV